MAERIDELGVSSSVEASQAPVVKGSRFIQAVSHLETVLKRIYRQIGIIVGEGAVVVLMGITTVHVFGRYFFQSPLRGVTEPSVALLTITIFLLGPFSQSIKRHISVDALTVKLPRITVAVLNIINHFIAIAFTIPMFWQTILQGNLMRESGTVTNIVRIPIYPFTYLIAFSWLMFIVIVIVQVILMIESLRKGVIQ